MFSYVVPKFHELWSTNSLKPDQTFNPLHYFVLSRSITSPLSGISGAPIATLNETALGLSAAQI